MGLLKRRRQKRRDRKLAAKLAKRQAKARTRHEKQLGLKKEKYVNKTAKKVLKQEKKDTKAQRKHEKHLATAAVDRARNRGFSPKMATKWVSGARVLAPIAIPLFYRGMTLLQGRQLSSTAKQWGLSSGQLAQFRGEGAPMKARIENIRIQLKNAPSGFARDAESRLEQLKAAISSAERMPTQQRQRALSKVSAELDSIQGEVHSKVTQ